MLRTKAVSEAVVPGRSERPRKALGWRPIGSGLAALALLCAAAPASGAAEGTPSSAAINTVGSETSIWSPGIHAPDRGLSGLWVQEFSRRKSVLASAGNRPRAVQALLGLLPLLAGEISSEALHDFLGAIENARHRHPLVRSYAAYLEGKLLEDAGKLDGARDRYQAEGFLLHWRIMGPFDNAGRQGEDKIFGPEKQGFDPVQSFQGKLPGEALTWSLYDETNTLRGAYVSFDEFVRPNVNVVGYATTWIKAEASSDVILHLGAGGAHKVWLNGHRVGSGAVYHAPNPLQDAYGMRLERGWNRILVKLAVEEGMWGFYARISALDGTAAVGVEIGSAPDIDSRDSQRRGRSPVQVEESGEPSLAAPSAVSLRTLLETAAHDRRANDDDRMALSAFYRWVQPFDPNDDTAAAWARGVDKIVSSPRSAWLQALLASSDNESRAALVRGIDRAHARTGETTAASREGAHLLANMLLQLAWRYRSLGLEREARHTLMEAQKAAPDNAAVEMARVDQLAADGFPLTALEWLDSMLIRYPHSSSIRKDKASRLLEAGRTREALDTLEALTVDHQGDGTIFSQRIEAHLRLGEVDDAVELAIRAVQSSPGLPAAHRQLARLMESRGDLNAARVALEAAIALSPLDPELHARSGHLLARSGSRDASIVAFQRSLELKPQQPGLRDLLSTLGAAGGVDLYERHGRSLKDVVENYANNGSDPRWKGKEAAVLHRMLAIKVSANGLGERLDHRVIHILDERGARNQATQSYSFDPDESYVDVRAARVMRKNGTIEEIGQTRFMSVAEAGYRMYYDQRQVQVHFPGLRAGDTLEVAFVRRDVAALNKFDNYFGDLVPLQMVEPVEHMEYRLEVPSSIELHFNQKLARHDTKDGQSKVYTLALEKIAGMRPESSMPGWTEVADYLHVSTYATWNEVSDWYWNFVKDQLLVDDAIRKGVRNALSTLPEDANERTKIDALYRHVIRKTRYVGLEFGVHGYKPYRTTDVYARKFGDCKDKASLLKVMLAEIGVEANLVLVRTRDQGAIRVEPASLSAFNHAIVYVPKYDLFLDGTAEWSGATELPVGDQGASVLVVRDGKGGDFLQIPISSADQNVKTTVQTVRLSADGSAKVEHRMDLRGTGAATWRVGFQSAEQRTERMTELLGRTHPGIEVAKLRLPNIGDVLKPVEVRADLVVPAWAQAGGQGSPALRFKVLGRSSKVGNRLAPQVKREQILVLTAPSRDVQTIHYKLPKGMRLTQVPADKTLHSPFGKFMLHVQSTGSTATVQTTLEFPQARISPKEYRAFREFLGKVDASLEQAFEAEVTP